MRGVAVVRVVVGAAGVAAIAFGLWSMREFSQGQFVSVGSWLIAGPIIHDGVFAVLVIGVCAVAVRLLPRSMIRPSAVALVIWGTFTMMALPVLSGRGGKPGIDTLLGHDYRANWLIGTAVVVGIVFIAAGVSRASNRRSG